MIIGTVIATTMTWWKEMAAAFATLMAAVAWLKSFYAKYEPMLRPHIEQAEIDYMNTCADGKISKDERKSIVMNQVALMEKEGDIKLNFITRRLISKLVDWIAEHMDDIKVDPISGKPIQPAV
jgi:hypothetical protein